MGRFVTNRCLTVALGVAALVVVALAGSTKAEAGRWRGSGIIGGMSAAEVMGWPYGRVDPYPAAASYVRPLGPPPGCVIWQQRVWDGYRRNWRKLRVCH